MSEENEAFGVVFVLDEEVSPDEVRVALDGQNIRISMCSLGGSDVLTTLDPSLQDVISSGTKEMFGEFDHQLRKAASAEAEDTEGDDE